MLLLRLSRVFLQAATMSPLHPRKIYFLLEQSFLLERDRHSPAAICFDLARVILQVATMSSLHQRKSFYFWIWHQCAKEKDTPGALCLCFEFSTVVLQGAAMPALHPRKVELFWSCPWERDSYSQHKWGLSPKIGGVEKSPIKKGAQNVRKGHLAHFELQASNYVSYMSIHSETC